MQVYGVGQVILAAPYTYMKRPWWDCIFSSNFSKLIPALCIHIYTYCSFKNTNVVQICGKHCLEIGEPTSMEPTSSLVSMSAPASNNTSAASKAFVRAAQPSGVTPFWMSMTMTVMMMYSLMRLIIQACRVQTHDVSWVQSSHQQYIWIPWWDVCWVLM